MAKTADRASSDGLAPREVGRQLRHVRRKQGLSRSEVARSAGLTRRELAAYERGRAEVPESDLWCLAGSCGVDVSELLPNRAPVNMSSDLSMLAIGDSIRHLRNPVENDEMLREYLAMIYELRNLPPGSPVPLRERDLTSLADALGGSPERIEARLIELIGMSHEEAAHLRAMILPPASLPALNAPAYDEPPLIDPNSPYAQLSTDIANDDDVVDFFSTPRSDDVFEPPPPPGPVSSANAWSDGVETPSYPAIDPDVPFELPPDMVESYDAPIAPTDMVESYDAPVESPTDVFASPDAPVESPTDVFASPDAPVVPSTDVFELHDTPFEPPTDVFELHDTPFEPPADLLEPPDTPLGADTGGTPPPPPVDPFAGPEPVAEPNAFSHDASTPPGPVGYLVDAPVAPSWPAHDPTLEAANDAPTVDWPTDAPAAPSEAPAWSLGDEPPAPPQGWADAEPLPRRLPLSGALAEPPAEPALEAPALEAPALDVAIDSDAEWAEPLPPASFAAPPPPPTAPPAEMFEVAVPVEPADVLAPTVEPLVTPEVAVPADEVEPAAVFEVSMPVEPETAPEVAVPEVAPEVTAPAEVFAPPVEPAAPVEPAEVFEVSMHVQRDVEPDGAPEAAAPTEVLAPAEVAPPTREPEIPPEIFAAAAELLAAPLDLDATSEMFATADVLTPSTPDVTPEPLLEPPASPEPPVEPIAWSADTQTEDERVTAPPSAAPTFERAGSHWRIGGIFPATATADDGALALRRADARWALADVSAPCDFVLETVVDFTAGAGFGVLFRATVDAQDRVSGYSFDIDPIAGGGGYLVRQWEDNRQHWRPLAQAGVPDPTLLFGKHTVTVSLRNDQLTVIVDGDTVLSIPALSRCSVELGREPCRGPHVGIQAWATTEVTVESFRVACF